MKNCWTKNLLSNKAANKFTTKHYHLKRKKKFQMQVFFNAEEDHSKLLLSIEKYWNF